MSNTMNGEPRDEPRDQKLTTADVAASANKQRPPRKEVGAARKERAAPQADGDLQADAAPQDDKPPPEDTRPQDDTAAGTTTRASGAETGAEARAEETRGNPAAATADRAPSTKREESGLAPLFAEDVATEFRSRWDVVQRGFVDDPRQSVRAGDELVAQVIKSLVETFSGQRASVEGERADQASTENLRLALRRYRSFFERLLSI
jgi:hypothetical protein